MKLDQVQLTNFRNISNATLLPSQQLTVITGKNGSGKSSLLEALFYLGFGRSFRTSKHLSVIRHESSSFSVFARCTDEAGKTSSVGLERSLTNSFNCSINGEHSQRLADLVSLIPVQLFTPQSTDLILGSPSERRKFCDWGLFHVEQSFHLLFQHYSKLLKQRNAVLKQNELRAPENQFWEQQLAVTGERLSSQREAYIEALTPIFNRISKEFLPEFSLEISYYRGWDKELPLNEVFHKKYEYDHKIGHTSSGPHKADLRFKVNHTSAQEILSRGQLRMAVAALQLSQTALFTQQSSRKSIFLLDDVGAELDLEKRERFIDGLLKMDTQIFITAIEKQQLEFIDKYNDKKMFHVEHGHVAEE
ncbi:DNA replication/repair protein RecF [Alteromonas pelagimontana]|uniref:DNA replication and repair protein RecF n=1 Tax=Alteromonas pelagimontana TaxID=1858656 RepID=A0A6M4MCT1_9ALTE|nr:DNA replication/repair protein RecF [Alteromonas pelagimontana]QJR80981.1 DNA replication/repair protein RecF [Alteromonas pelagimontana]